MESSKILNLILGVTLLILVVKDGYFKSDKNQTKDNVAKGSIETILNRKSVRIYTDQMPSKGQIDTLLRAAMAAPTAANKQPWAFIVVTERAILDDLAQNLPYAKMVAKAKLAIVVCGDLSKTLEGNGAEYWIQDCSAATENLLLAAEAAGLGAVWTGIYPEEERVKYVSERLKLPAKFIPLNVIPIGYPTGIEKVKDKYREENIYHNELNPLEEKKTN